MSPRLLFVPNPHVRLDREWAAPYVPLELLSGMAVVEAAGSEAALFDVNRLVEHGRLRVEPWIWGRAAELLVEAEPDAVVLESWSGTLHSTLLLARAARALLPRTPLVLAGAGSSAIAGELLAAFPDLDGVIRGELEPALAVLARRPLLDRALAEAPGLARRAAGALPPPAAVDELDALPRPALHLALLHPGEAIPVEAGRGCAQACSFCALAGHWPARYRPRSPALLAAEMLDLGRRFPGALLDLTQDPMFFGEPARLRALCVELAGRGLRWTCHARVDRLGDAELRELARAGCCGILFGVESGAPAIQRAIGKRIDLGRLEPTLEAAARLGIETRASFILGHPEEDEPALAATLDALLRARRAGAADTPVQLLRAYPGSEVHTRHAAALEPEELLCTAAAGDAEARALIAAHPRLLPASYRVPGRLPRERLLGAWIAAAALPAALEALARSGLSASRLAAALSVGAARTLDDAALEASSCLRALGRELAPRVDGIALADLLRYQQALFAIGREDTSDPSAADGDARAALAVAERALPFAIAPWRLLELATDHEQVVDAEIASGRCARRRDHLLVAKVASAGEASYYTRRSFAVESFALDEVGAALLPLCDGERDLAALALEVAARLQRSPARTLAACVEVVAELVEAGVLALGSCEGAISPVR